MSIARLLLITTPVTLISKAIADSRQIIARAEGIDEMQELYEQGTRSK